MSTKTLIGTCLALALASGLAMANDNSPMGVNRMPYPVLPSNVARCAPGFTAVPATIDPKNPYGQSYVCMTSAPVCSPGFQLVAVYLPPAPGQLVGPVSPSSPLTMRNGRVIYTCAEPPRLQ
jgi:hypothetical protein